MAATPKQDQPKKVTIYGRLSFPKWTAQEAYDSSQKGKYPAKDLASASPELSLVVEQDQWDKFLTHVKDKFFPYCVEQEAKGEKRDSLSQQEVDDLLDGIENRLDNQPYNTPFKAVTEKTADLAPEAVGVIKFLGNKGVDIELKAIVTDEAELKVDDGTARSYPLILPIGETKHQMYPGAYVAVTANLYAYHNGKPPGFSAGCSVAVFKADADRFGGGVAVDEDEIFMD